MSHLLMIEYLQSCIALWVVVTTITKGHVFSGLRNAFRKAVFALATDRVAEHFILIQTTQDGSRTWVEPESDEPAYSETYGYDFISCSLCVGFWVTAICTGVWHLEFQEGLQLWGGAYMIDRLTR